MKKRMKKLLSISLLLMIVVCSVVGCSSSMDYVEENISGVTNDSFTSSGDFLDYENKLDSGSSGESDSESKVSDNRKIIEKVYLTAETKEFDSLLEKLNTEIDRVGGYIENSSVSGNSFSYEGHRNANFVVRIPSEKSAEFTTFVSENSTVTSQSPTT